LREKVPELQRPVASAKLVEKTAADNQVTIKFNFEALVRTKEFPTTRVKSRERPE
jgi:hypothetical protein